MEEQYRPWERMIRDLYHRFKILDDERSLLSFIDTSILNDHQRGEKKGIEWTFMIALERLSKIYDLNSPILCYIFLGGEHMALLQWEVLSDYPLLLKLPTLLIKLGDQNKIKPMILSHTKETEDLFHQFNGINTILLYPLYSPTGTLTSLLIAPDHDLSEGSRLNGKNFQESLDAVVFQLSIAYNHFLDEYRKNNMALLWKIFLLSDLAPMQCFRDLVQIIPSFLPSFGLLRMQIAPEVQILILNKSPHSGEPMYLTIRATTGDEPIKTRIDIEDSICGLLVERSPEKLPYFCDDPNKAVYGTRFKNYRESKRRIRTELAVRLFDGPEFIGILNFESELEDAFSIHHKEAVLELANQIAPMIAVFEQRVTHNTLMHYSLGATTSRYLDSLASIFRHGINTPILNLRGNLDLINDLLTEDLPKALSSTAGDSSKNDSPKKEISLDKVLSMIKSALERLYAVRKQIGRYTDEFARSISGFGIMGRNNLRQLLEEVKEFTENSLMQEIPERVMITCLCDEDVNVFCSPLIKQYLYCLMQNAIQSIQERMKDAPQEGLIEISVLKDDSISESQKRDLNKRWIVKIRDNGTGVTLDQLAKLRQFHYGTRFRAGTGFGFALFATQRYLASIGGWVTLDSVFGEYFEASMYLDEYRQELHGPLSLEISK